MDFKIIVDSCCDLPAEYKENKHFVFVPLTLEIGDYRVVDDDKFDQLDFINRMKNSEQCPRSACPSPDTFREAYTSDEKCDIYVVTLSAQLSGSYNSAELGKKLYIEEGGMNNVEIFDSKSASCGEGLIALTIYEEALKGSSFSEVVDKVSKYRDGMNTYFVLESLENLRKNGRLSNIKAILAQALNIKPVMGADMNGNIIKLEQIRGMNKALNKMVTIINNNTIDPSNKSIAIAHCNCPERAMYVKNELMKSNTFKDIIIVNTAGVSTLYASDGGIIVTV